MAVTTWHAIHDALVTLLEGLTLAYPTGEAETFKELEGALAPDREPTSRRHRSFVLEVDDDVDGPRITQDQRDAIVTLRIVLRYDARRDAPQTEKTMGYDRETLKVQLETTANWPAGVYLIGYVGSKIDRNDRARPVQTVTVKVNYALAN